MKRCNGIIKILDELNRTRENGEESILEKRCYCGAMMKYGEGRELAACDICGRNYHWASGKGRNQRLGSIYVPHDFQLELISKTKPGNLIAQPYSGICSEMREQRFDIASARQFAKQARKIGNLFKMEYSLVEHRKTVKYI